MLAPEGLLTLRLDGSERRLLVPGPCRYAGGIDARPIVRCGQSLYAVEADAVRLLAPNEPVKPNGDGRVRGCTNGAAECVCTDGWRPEVSSSRLLWRHANGDSRTLARATHPEDPFVSEDCQIVGFHDGGKIYLVQLRTGRIGLLATGSTLRWPR